MITIFHGTDTFKSRQALNQAIKQINSPDFLKLDQKKINLETIQNFLNTQSLLSQPKVILLNNFFSLHPATRTKIATIINQTQHQVFIWQNKKLNASQTKIFPDSKNFQSNLSSILWTCLNAFKPKSLKSFLPLYQKLLQTEPYDLFLYLLKNKVRKELSSYSAFPTPKLKKFYLKLIKLDYQNKTGQLTDPKEQVLERLFINVLS